MEHQRRGRADDDIPAGAAGLHVRVVQQPYHPRHGHSAMYFIGMFLLLLLLRTHGHVCATFVAGAAVVQLPMGNFSLAIPWVLVGLAILTSKSLVTMSRRFHSARSW